MEATIARVLHSTRDPLASFKWTRAHRLARARTALRALPTCCQVIPRTETSRATACRATRVQFVLN
jgi:hypothetical protein